MRNPEKSAATFFELIDSRGASPGSDLEEGAPFLRPMRLRLDGNHVEALISMAAAYIHSKICDASSDMLKAVIPYRYVRGKNHGRIEGRFRRWDMRIDACGKEGVVDELQRRIWHYEQQRFDILTGRWEVARRSCVYILNDSDSPRESSHLIFSDRKALGLLRLGGFVRDWCELAHPNRFLEESIEEEKRLMSGFIAHQHREVLRTLPPKVTRIPGRYTVRVRPTPSA